MKSKSTISLFIFFIMCSFTYQIDLSSMVRTVRHKEKHTSTAKPLILNELTLSSKTFNLKNNKIKAISSTSAEATKNQNQNQAKIKTNNHLKKKITEKNPLDTAKEISNTINKPISTPPPFKTAVIKLKHSSKILNTNTPFSKVKEEIKNEKLACKTFENLASKITDFDITTSNLRSELMNSSRHTLSEKEKKTHIIYYFKKINDLNGLLQQYKINLFEIKQNNSNKTIVKSCESKLINLLKNVEKNFFNLFSLFKDEIKDKKIGLSLIIL